MSFEGYEVHYCANGHIIGHSDAYGSDDVYVCLCGKPDTYCELVDTTNGCECSDGSCPAHPKHKVIGHSPVPCQSCTGGKVSAIAYGTLEPVDILCRVCGGVGLVNMDVYDVSK